MKPLSPISKSVFSVCSFICLCGFFTGLVSCEKETIPPANREFSTIDSVAAAKKGLLVMEEGMTVLEKANSETTALEGIQKLETSIDHLISGGLYKEALDAGYFVIRWHRDNSNRYDEGIQLFNRLKDLPIPDTSQAKVKVILTTAPCYASLFQEEVALDWLEVVLQIHQSRKDLGLPKGIGDYFLQDVYNKQGMINDRVGVMLNESGLQTAGMRRLKLGLKQLELALDLIKKAPFPPTFKLRLIVANKGNQGLLYSDLGEYEKAITYQEEVLDMLDEFNIENSMELALNAKYNIADALLAKGDTEAALDIHTITNAAYRRLNASDFDLSESYSRLGKVYAKMGLYQKSLENYQKALEHYSIGLADQNSGYKWKTPDINHVYIKVELLETLIGRSHSLWKAFESNNDASYSQSLLETYKLGFDLLTYLKTYNFSESARYSIAKYGAHLTEGYLKLINVTGENVEEAFIHADAHRSSFLLQGITLNRLHGTKEVDDSVRNREEELDNRINSLEGLTFFYKKHHPDSSITHNYKLELEGAKSSKDSLQNEIEKKHPSYYQLRYGNAIKNIEDIQENLLEENQMLLEYFMGEDYFYTFEVTKKGIKMYTDSAASLRTWSRELFTTGILDTIPNEPNLGFIPFAQKLYQKLLAPSLRGKSEIPERLIIIPDGELAYVPFEMLMKPSNTKDFREMGFAIEDHAFMYAYSAGTLALQQSTITKNQPTGSLLAVAPEFESAPKNQQITSRSPYSNQFFKLEHSLNEVKQLDVSNEKLLTGPEVSSKKLMQLWNDYQIIHLSTHAEAHNEFPDSSLIAFANNELFYVRDLPNDPLLAKMLVLSGCETGYGTILEGEGIASISRYFTLKGIQSVIASMWKVNDLSTSELMISFYKHLKNGDPKDIALQKAKLSVIHNEANIGYDYAHPKFWAGFTAYGDPASLDISEENHFWKCLIGCLVVLGGLIGLVLRRRATRNSIR